MINSGEATGLSIELARDYVV